LHEIFHRAIRQNGAERYVSSRYALLKIRPAIRLIEGNPDDWNSSVLFLLLETV